MPLGSNVDWSIGNFEALLLNHFKRKAVSRYVYAERMSCVGDSVFTLPLIVEYPLASIDFDTLLDSCGVCDVCNMVMATPHILPM